MQDIKCCLTNNQKSHKTIKYNKFAIKLRQIKFNLLWGLEMVENVVSLDAKKMFYHLVKEKIYTYDELFNLLANSLIQYMDTVLQKLYKKHNLNITDLEGITEDNIGEKLISIMGIPDEPTTIEYKRKSEKDLFEVVNENRKDHFYYNWKLGKKPTYASFETRKMVYHLVREGIYSYSELISFISDESKSEMLLDLYNNHNLNIEDLVDLNENNIAKKLQALKKENQKVSNEMKFYINNKKFLKIFIPFLVLDLFLLYIYLAYFVVYHLI